METKSLHILYVGIPDGVPEWPVSIMYEVFDAARTMKITSAMTAAEARDWAERLLNAADDLDAHQKWAKEQKEATDAA